MGFCVKHKHTCRPSSCQITTGSCERRPGAHAGFHPAESEREDEAEAHGPGRLQGAEGRRGLVRQQPLGGLLRERAGGPDQPRRPPRGVAAQCEAAGPVPLHPPGGRERHRLLRLHQARPG